MKVWLAFLFVLCASSAQAMFIRIETEEVPIARLITNAEKHGTKMPENAALLARLHAMAWARGEKVVVKKGSDEPWFGYLPPLVEHNYVDPTLVRDAKTNKHLDEAIRLYRLAVEKLQDRPALKLGLAWCLAQKPDAESKAEAKTMLRKLGDEAWAKEKDQEHWGMGDYGVAHEAARYLIPLLDATADRKELDDLAERQKIVEQKPRPITPIVVPLGDDVTLAGNVDTEARVSFDLDGSGRAREWGWVRGDGAWLVWDADGDGRVKSGLDLFGSVTFWMFWDDGYAALRALDDDGDGLVSGDELQGLALWKDDGDGVSEAGEVVPVRDQGIVALRTDALTIDGIPTIDEGVMFVDGHTAPTWDWVTTGR